MKKFFRKLNFNRNKKSTKKSSKALVILMVMIGLTMRICLNIFFLNINNEPKVTTNYVSNWQNVPKNQETFLSLHKQNFTEEIKATKSWRISVVVRDNIDLY